MAPLLQAKLLRVLQEREVDRVGGRKPVSISVRVIATTNKDLRKLISRGQFREDLFFRLNVIPLRILPLRERKDDIAVLTAHFAGKYGAATDPNVNEESLKVLTSFGWPGNVRELEKRDPSILRPAWPFAGHAGGSVRPGGRHRRRRAAAGRLLGQ